MKKLTFYSQADFVAAIKEGKDAFATQFVDLGHMDLSESEYIAAYLFDKQGAEIEKDQTVRIDPPAVSDDNLPEELVKAMTTIQKYATAVTLDGSGPIFTL